MKWDERSVQELDRTVQDPCITACGSQLHFGYHHARLIMNRHFCGPIYGLPLKILTSRRA